MSSLELAAKPRSERLLKLRAICCEHALDLIESAERVLTGTRDIDTQDELMRWFWEAVSDEQMQKRLFSQSFLAKIDEFNGNIREWTSWAKAEFEEIANEEKALMEAEASRLIDKSIAPKERWRMKLRIFCISHSIRQKMLNFWNESVPLAKLHYVSSEEMLLELTLGDWNTGKDVVVSGQAFSKVFLAALNIGTAGFFWHEMPKKSADYFESMEDLENPKMKLATTGGFDLQRQWRTGENGRKLTVLEETYLNNAAKCAMVFARMKEEDAQPIFGPYLQGLALLGKSDAFISLDLQTIQAFHTALGNAMTYYSDWDGQRETFIPTLHRVFADMIPEEEHRDQIFKHFKEQVKTMEELQEHAVSAKRVVDLYLTLKAHRQWHETVINSKSKLSHYETL